jgi:hypothetical protein
MTRELEGWRDHRAVVVDWCAVLRPQARRRGVRRIRKNKAAVVGLVAMGMRTPTTRIA